MLKAAAGGDAPGTLRQAVAASVEQQTRPQLPLQNLRGRLPKQRTLRLVMMIALLPGSSLWFARRWPASDDLWCQRGTGWISATKIKPRRDNALCHVPRNPPMRIWSCGWH